MLNKATPLWSVILNNFDELNFLGKNLTFKHSVKKLRGRRLAKIEGP